METVTGSQCERTRFVKLDGNSAIFLFFNFEIYLLINMLFSSADNTHLDIPAAEPWFEQWRELFLSVQYPSDHEFTRHFLSCLIVVSSADPNPLESANVLLQNVQMMQNVTPSKIPKWFSTNALNCFVLLHDASVTDITMAQQNFESLKLSFGENKCFLLAINSQQGQASSDSADPWLKFLNRHPKSVSSSQMRKGLF